MQVWCIDDGICNFVSFRFLMGSDFDRSVSWLGGFLGGLVEGSPDKKREIFLIFEVGVLCVALKIFSKFFL